MSRFEVEDVSPAIPARPTRPWCLFQCGQDGYAVGLEAVAEVVEVERLVRLPHSPPRVLGLCALRREIIPVIDLHAPGPDILASKGLPLSSLLVLILRTRWGSWAIRINAEGTIATEEALDEPVVGASPPGPGLIGTVRRGDLSYAVIDHERTWQDVRQNVEDWYCDRLGRDTAPKLHPTSAAARVG